METLEILEAVQTLPSNQKMYIAEQIIGSLRKEQEKAQLRKAAEMALFDYTNDKALTEFTALDGEDFLELFGAIKDDTFVEPDDIPEKYDVSREPL
jgi:hypothetical protein